MDGRTNHLVLNLCPLFITSSCSSNLPPLSDQGPSLADAFEYVMYGKVYRIEGNEGPGDSGRL